MGSCVHEVLEWVYLPENRNKPYFTFDELCRAYDEIWVKNWHDDIFIARCKYNNQNYNKKLFTKLV